MLSTSSTALLTLGIVIVLIVPGPTNTLFATAGLQRGMRRSVHLIGAEFAGYLVSISVLGFFLSHAATSLTWIPALLRIASSLYLAVLSVRMWQTASAFPSPTRYLSRHSSIRKPSCSLERSFLRLRSRACPRILKQWQSSLPHWCQPASHGSHLAPRSVAAG
jgi:threonine/homoserine/homoserine lactone efflux protein